MDNLESLTELFARLGARNPEQWARSQVEENIPQLARFLFLRQAWKLVIDEHDESWIASLRSQAEANPNAPGAEVGPALDRLLAVGISADDLTKLIRVMQWRLLSGICYLLDDPGDVEEEVQDIAWRLFQVNENEEPIAVLGGLQESVLDTDPTGREMQPR
jgi:hypothetical protein